MNTPAFPWTTKVALGSLAAGIAVAAAFATLGWARHGEQIFVGMLQSGWMTCF